MGLTKLKLVMARRIRVVSAIVVIVLAVGVFFVFNQLLSRPAPKYYSFNEEIRDFRTCLDEETSVIFTGWTINSSSATNDVVYVNYTVRNVAHGYADEILVSSVVVPAEVPQLRYGSNYYCSTDFEDYGWRFYSPYSPTLLPNQSQNGYLKYEITKGYQPTELVYPFPSIIIDFS